MMMIVSLLCCVDADDDGSLHFFDGVRPSEAKFKNLAVAPSSGKTIGETRRRGNTL